MKYSFMYDVGVEDTEKGVSVFVRKDETATYSPERRLYERTRALTLEELGKLFPDAVINILETQNRKTREVIYSVMVSELSRNKLQYEGMDTTLFFPNEVEMIGEAVKGLVNQYVAEPTPSEEK